MSLYLDGEKAKLSKEGQPIDPYQGWSPPAAYRNTAQLSILSMGDLTLFQEVVQRLASSPGPIPFVQLPTQFKATSLSRLAEAVYFGLQHLMLFAAMDRNNMTPVLTLWPTIAQRLHRPPPKPPAPVQPDQSFDSAFLMEDMTAFLIAASAEPLRVRSNV